MGGREQKKAAREAALAQLAEEDERDAKIEQAEADRKAKIYDDMQRRKSSKSPMKGRKNDPTEVEMSDDDENANMGATFKSDF